MKKLILFLTGLSLSTVLFAGESNTVTLEGTGLCGKCTLETAEKCTNVLEVAGTDGEPIYFTFSNNISHGKYFCKARTPGLVVKGTLTQEDGKLILAAASVDKK